MDSNALKSRIVLNGLKITELLERLRKRGLTLSKSAFYRKINGKSEFDRKEMLVIAEELGISSEEIITIFFSEKVS